MLASIDGGPLAVADLFQNLQSDGLLGLLGGHYSWPGEPTTFAVESVKVIASSNRNIGLRRQSSFVFLNDIGAADACLPGGTCPVHKNNQNEVVLSKALKAWVARVLPSVEKTLQTKCSEWHQVALSIGDELKSAPPGEFGELPSYLRLCEPEAYCRDDIDLWSDDLERFLYTVAKPLFRPLLLTRRTGQALPEVIFERAMNNGASRLLHDIRKKGKSTGLEIDRSMEGVGRYVVRGLAGQEIELRTERNGPKGTSASNKCPVLLAYLFYYICKKLVKQHGPADSLSVFYLIPCFDRGRLAEGMQAFVDLFTDVSDWLPCSRVTLGCGFYADAGRERLVCDLVYKTGSALPTTRTCETVCQTTKRTTSQ